MTYFRPSTPDEALEILSKDGTRLRPIAGCTDVGIMVEEKLLPSHDFLDLSYLDSLRGISFNDEFIQLGSLVTHAEITTSPLLQKHAAILCEACGTVGSPLIRNRATIGGNICHASPSGDSIPALMTLNAEFLLKSSQGERWISSCDFFTGPGKTVRRSDELLFSVRFSPLSEGYYCLFQKLGQRKALACSKASLAFVCRVEGNRIQDVRIAMGAVAATVRRSVRTEEYLAGNEISSSVISEACRLIQEEASPIDDLRSTAKYRRSMMGALLSKALSSIG